MIKIKALIEDANTFADRLKKIVLKHFPDSFVKTEFDSNISPSVGLYFALGKDKSEWSNGILHNDPLHHVLLMGLGKITKDGRLPEKMKLEKPNIGGVLKTKDWDFIKLGLKAKTGTPEQLLKYMDTYFGKVKKVVMDNKDRLDDIIKNKY